MERKLITYVLNYEDFIKSLNVKRVNVPPTLNDIIDAIELNDVQASALMNNILYYPDRPVNIELSTIHKSKGRERDNVLIIDEIRPGFGYFTTTEEEKRVFYVGITRARENLYIFNPMFGGSNHFMIGVYVDKFKYY